jgi:hypothetical protein
MYHSLLLTPLLNIVNIDSSVMVTQIPTPSSQTDTLVSVRLDGLIDILQGLGLNDKQAIADALLSGTGQAEGESIYLFHLSRLTLLLHYCRTCC